MFRLGKSTTDDGARAQEASAKYARIEESRKAQYAIEADNLVKFNLELDKDKAAYSLRAEKFGDALAFLIEGVTYAKYPQTGKVIEKVCHTVNLIVPPNTISLVNGRPPDMLGMKWARESYTMGGGVGNASIVWEERGGDCRGYYGRGDSFFRTDHFPVQSDSTGGIRFGNSYSTDDLHATMDCCCRDYEPDMIRFDGAGAWLRIPFGKGAEVYQIILDALGK